jgi:hypothetical protein
MIFYLLKIQDPSKYSVNNDVFLKLLTELAEWQYMSAGNERRRSQNQNATTAVVISELRPTNKKCLHCEKILPHGTHLRISLDPGSQWRQKCIPCGSLIDASGAVVKIQMFKKLIKDSADLLEHQDCRSEYQSTTTEIVPNDECPDGFVDLAVVRHYRESQIVEFVRQPIDSLPGPGVAQDSSSAVHKD